MKLISQLDQNGYFIEAISADISPLEPDTYLIPRACVDALPPTIPEGKRAKWENGWVFEDISSKNSPNVNSVSFSKRCHKEKTYFFMGGLPRSGSTLLSSILNQNPILYSGPSSPVLTLMHDLEDMIFSHEFYNAHPKPRQANNMVSSLIDNYYEDITKPIIIDKNRGWPAKVNYIKDYFEIDYPKILVTVRNIDEIITSFIMLHQRNNNEGNFIDNMLIANNMPLSIENRCIALLTDSIVNASYRAIQQAVMLGNTPYLFFIEYDDLIFKPELTMKKIYDFLEIEPYDSHDYQNIVNIDRERDSEVYGFSDMHHVRPFLKKESIDPKDVLPKSILNWTKGMEFWKN